MKKSNVLTNVAITDKDKVDLLYSHYQETYNLCYESKNRRNKMFVLLCILESISFLTLIKPSETFNMLLNGINSSLGITLDIGNTLLQSLLWAMIVYVTIRYVQDTLYVERQYDYLDGLEKKIKEITNINVFDREGDNYSKDYPMVLNFIDLFYKMISPILFFSINLIHIIMEWQFASTISFSLVCDVIICISVLIILWFYFFEIHSKITEWSKRHCRVINWFAVKLRKILKEV